MGRICPRRLERLKMARLRLQIKETIFYVFVHVLILVSIRELCLTVQQIAN